MTHGNDNDSIERLYRGPGPGGAPDDEQADKTDELIRVVGRLMRRG